MFRRKTFGAGRDQGGQSFGLPAGGADRGDDFRAAVMFERGAVGHWKTPCHVIRCEPGTPLLDSAAVRLWVVRIDRRLTELAMAHHNRLET